jgi:hypothetical protein
MIPSLSASRLVIRVSTRNRSDRTYAALWRALSPNAPCPSWISFVGAYGWHGVLAVHAYRLARKLNFISFKPGSNEAPMRNATVVASTSITSKCSRRETIGL